MPFAPQRPCKRPGCPGFATPGTRHCAAHATHARAETAATRAHLDQQRGTASARGYTSRWSEYARQFRAKYPISAGYLTRTALWTPHLAQQFHALREAAIDGGQYSTLFQHSAHFTGAGLRYLEQFPIYTWHASPRPEPSAEVDHIVSVAGPTDPLFWAEWNHQALSKIQHSEKTARFDGGFRGAKSPAPAATEDGGFRGPQP
jgi:5-methylcytosine-specific restriction endonuclease McrA